MLENICIRILILDISEKKSNHELYGFTVHEEYNFYIKHFWKNESYKCDLAIRYAEGSRLQKLKEKYFVILQNEINEKINIDKDMISKKFHENMNEFQMLNKDQGDIHKNGRSVSKIEFDNGSILYYKPHSLDKDIKYQQLYKYLCEKAGISCREVRCLSRQTYGWEENIENKSCNTKEEIERYYFRLGIHLFLGYALGATDLHGENIVAYGEHPVIIDMETYPGYITKNSGSSTEEKAEIKIREKIMISVLNTGILPVLTWGTGNNRVLMSAVNMHGKIRTPFKMPVVKDDKTSNIHIEYEQVEFEIKECIVRLNGEVVNSEEYTGEIIRGFRMAYTEILQNQKLRNMLKTFFQGKSRVILRHTQQYYMYLFASFHPDYMKDRKQREELLQVLHKKGETQLQKELRDYEIQSLLELDIPYFEIDGNSRSIFDGNGKEYQGYLPCTPYESWIEHMKQLSCQDMEQQCDYIRLSMGLLNHGYIGEKNPRWADENTCIHQIAEWICRTAVIDGADIGWAGLHFWDNGYWSLKPCGMYLYDGIAGIVLFLAKYLDRYQDSSCRQDVEKIYKLAIEKLEKYTDLRCEQNEVPEPLATGLYDGESSIVYVYLILYEITGQEKWIKNAQKHFEIVAKLLPKDENMDYLSGNAGAIVAAMKLYQLTGEIEYCTAAVETEKDLWKKGQRMEVGYGWKLKNLKYPLSGLSHGNSGFLMAYVELYKMTYDQEYLKKIKLLLSYEDILYSEDLKNWIDLRDPDGRKTMRGWCHGAPGILLSRMSIMDILPDDKQIKKDILRAVSTLFHNEREKKICLCHGMTGNLLIMKKYLEKNPDDDLRQKYERQFSNLKEQLQDMRSLMVTETLNPAFMNGITGVGMAMMLLNMD